MPETRRRRAFALRARRARPPPRTRRVVPSGPMRTARRGRGRAPTRPRLRAAGASTGTASSSDRAAASSTRSVHTKTSARFAPPTPRNARSWSMSTCSARRRGSCARRLAAAAPGCEPRANLAVEDGDAAAVAELVGDERDHRHRVDAASSRVMRSRQRRGHQAAGVEQAHDVAVLFDAVLVAHRAAHPRGGRQLIWRTSSSGR